MTAPTDVDARLAALAATDDVDEVRRLYDDWAPTYDGEEVAARLGYAGPAAVAARVADLVDPRTDVLDAGCGTGLVGVTLAARGFRSVDGLDLSTGMIRQARRRRVYHDLGPADLGRGVPGARAKFGVVTCVGAFGPGHLGPGALTGLARATVAGGYLVAAVAEDTWTGAGYAAQVAGLAEQGYARPVAGTDGPDPDLPGRLLVLQVPR